jgi:hypothetical protein
VTDYGHDEAMRDLHNIGQPDTDFYSSREGCRHRLAAYIESLERKTAMWNEAYEAERAERVRLAAYIESMEKQRDWLAQWAGMGMTYGPNNPFRTPQDWMRLAEEATRD